LNEKQESRGQGKEEELGLNNLLNHEPDQYDLEMTLIFLPGFLATKPNHQTPAQQEKGQDKPTRRPSDRTESSLLSQT
jgi:hypothetical protein